MVFFCEILEHLALDPINALAEIPRVFTPGGWLVLRFGAPSPAGEALTLTARSGDASASWVIPCDGCVFEVDAAFDRWSTAAEEACSWAGPVIGVSK